MVKMKGQFVCRNTQNVVVSANAMADTVDIRRFLDDLQAQGRYSFTDAEARDAVTSSPRAAAEALRRLRADGRVATPRKGFDVIVPPEYREAGCPPASWFIDDLMRFTGRPYYVALLSAAAVHGAGRSHGPVGDDLKTHRLLVGGAVDGGGAQQSHVVGPPRKAHEIIDEPACRRAPRLAVLGRDDDVEALARRSDAAADAEATQRLGRGARRRCDDGLGLSVREGVSALRLQIVEKPPYVNCICHFVCRNYHILRVSANAMAYSDQTESTVAMLASRL